MGSNTSSGWWEIVNIFWIYLSQLHQFSHIGKGYLWSDSDMCMCPLLWYKLLDTRTLYLALDIFFQSIIFIVAFFRPTNHNSMETKPCFKFLLSPWCEFNSFPISCFKYKHNLLNYQNCLLLSNLLVTYTNNYIRSYNSRVYCP